MRGSIQRVVCMNYQWGHVGKNCAERQTLEWAKRRWRKRTTTDLLARPFPLMRAGLKKKGYRVSHEQLIGENSPWMHISRELKIHPDRVIGMLSRWLPKLWRLKLAEKSVAEHGCTPWALIAGYKMENCVASESLVLWKNLSSATSHTTNRMLWDGYGTPRKTGENIHFITPTKRQYHRSACLGHF